MSDYGPFERHVLPNGTELYYRDENHTYWRSVKPSRTGNWSGSGRLLGNSTVAKAFDSGGDGLKWWATRWNNVGVAALANECLDFDEPTAFALDWLRSGPTIDEALERNKLTWDDVLGRAGARGTNVHREALQAMAEGRPVPNFDALSAEEKRLAMGVATFWHEHEPKPLHAECVVADLDLGVAGRFDLIAEMRGALGLFDAKTKDLVPRKKERPFYPVPDQVQLAGYDYLAGVSGYPRTVAQWVLYVDQDGDYELVESKAHHGHFKLAVQVHEATREIRAARNAKQGDLLSAR